MNGFIEMVEASMKGKERSMNVDEAHRETAYPDICTPECEHITCPFRRLENKGRPCEKKFQQYKNQPNNLIDPYGMQRQIELAVQKAFKPLNDRLTRIETSNIERSFTFNGKKMHTYTPKLVFSQTLRIDCNMN